MQCIFTRKANSDTSQVCTEFHSAVFGSNVQLQPARTVIRNMTSETYYSVPFVNGLSRVWLAFLTQTEFLDENSTSVKSSAHSGAFYAIFGAHLSVDTAEIHWYLSDRFKTVLVFLTQWTQKVLDFTQTRTISHPKSSVTIWSTVLTQKAAELMEIEVRFFSIIWRNMSKMINYRLILANRKNTYLNYHFYSCPRLKLAVLLRNITDRKLAQSDW